jgi:hypothetical protein
MAIGRSNARVGPTHRRAVVLEKATMSSIALIALIDFECVDDTMHPNSNFVANCCKCVPSPYLGEYLVVQMPSHPGPTRCSADQNERFDVGPKAVAPFGQVPSICRTTSQLIFSSRGQGSVAVLLHVLGAKGADECIGVATSLLLSAAKVAVSVKA